MTLSCGRTVLALFPHSAAQRQRENLFDINSWQELLSPAENSLSLSSSWEDVEKHNPSPVQMGRWVPLGDWESQSQYMPAYVKHIFEHFFSIIHVFNNCLLYFCSTSASLLGTEYSMVKKRQCLHSLNLLLVINKQINIKHEMKTHKTGNKCRQD